MRHKFFRENFQTISCTFIIKSFPEKDTQREKIESPIITASSGERTRDRKKFNWADWMDEMNETQLSFWIFHLISISEWKLCANLTAKKSTGEWTVTRQKLFTNWH